MKKYLEQRGIIITWFQIILENTFELIGFLLSLIPAALTLYLTDTWITSGKMMPTFWIIAIVVGVLVIHLYKFFFVNYYGQMQADRLSNNYRKCLGRKIISSSIPEYEKQNKARIQYMSHDVRAIYSMGSYIKEVPADIIKVLLVVVILFIYADTAIA